MAEMVRVYPDTHAKLKELAAHAGETLPETLAKAVEAYRRQVFLKRANRAYAALRRDRTAWKAEQAERKAWEATLADGQ